jgi:hypothetical protein
MAMRMAVISFLVAATVWSQPASEFAFQGNVTDALGAPLPGVQVTAMNEKGEAIGSARTDKLGGWSLQVPAGRYQMKFEAEGFGEQTRPDMTVPGTGGTVVLTPGQAGEKSADDGGRTVRYRPIVDSQRTHQGDFITRRQVLELPVNRRDYLSLAALTPGVSEVNDYVGVSDAPLVQAPRSGLSFGGNNGRGNVFWLDGGENYINTGGVRPSISQEAVAEFQVSRSNYSAEFGGGIGGIVNIVSMAGSNEVHGDIFGFLRDSRIQARNYFDPENLAYTRSQVGGTLGAPVRKDRTFVFLAFERLQRRQNSFVPVGREREPLFRLTQTQQELADLFRASRIPDLVALGTATQDLLLTRNFPRTFELFDANRGIFPFGESATQGSARLDHRLSDNHQVFLRFNAGAGLNQNSQVEGLRGFSRGIISDLNDQTLMLTSNHVISARLVSESRFSLARLRYNARNQDPIGPSIDIAGYGFFGKDWTLPSALSEWHGQLQQNMFYTPGRHSMRFGIDVNPVRAAASVPTSSGGRFSFGEYLPLGALYNLVSGDPNTAANLASTLVLLGQSRLVPSLEMPLTAIQAFNLGIPAFYIQGFGDASWKAWFHHYNFFFNDVIQVHPRLIVNAGVRYELEVPPSSMGTDPNNIAPRVALAWAVTGDRKTVVRAGYGLFYLRHQNQLAAATEIQSGTRYHQVVVPLTGLPGTRNPVTGLPITSADIYQRLLQQGIIGNRAIEASDIAPFGIVPGPNTPFQVLFQPPRDFINGYAQQTSFEIERAIGATALSASYNFSRGAHLPRLRDLNAAYGPPGPLGEPTIIPHDPLVSQLPVIESAANSFYHALIVQANRRFGNRLTLNTHYTFSKSIDEVTDINFLPNDSLNTRKERGLSTFDQRHRFVGSAIVTLPEGTSWSRVPKALFGGFYMSPIVIAGSGHPFNVVTGDGANEYRRPAGAGRNIGQGPDYLTVDMRVSRRIFLGGPGSARDQRTHLELIAESFNILNRTNFRRLNNTVGQVTVDQLPRPLVGRRGDVADPLSFVSAFDSRQLQFALKLVW